MATKEKAQDEKNLKILRELASLPWNKYCFDCQQRGPTYVNVTNGSFVCTACSGILRGLNPPHRVKSITMASFTQEEMELTRSRGNEYCKHVWLGKYDPQASAESEYQNIQKIRDFMIQKYEDKRYYVEPEIAIKKMKARAPSAPVNSVSQSKSQSSIQTKSSPQIQRPGWMSQDFTDSKGDAKVTDVFRSESGELFKSWPKTGDAAESSFADFSQAFGNTVAPVTLTSQQALTSSSQVGSFTSTTAFATAVAISNQTITSSKPSQKKPAPPPPDRYAALADLDNQMHTLQSQTVPVHPAPVAATAAMTTVLPFWSTSASAYGSTPMTNPSILATESKNPFGHTTSTWSQQNLISSANPFQTIPQPRTNPLGNPSVPVQHPVANGLSNASVTAQQNVKNGSVPSIWPPVPSNGWSTSPFPNGQVDPLQNKNPLGSDHYNPWAQALAPGVINPFVNGSESTGVPVAMPRTNTGNNPFL